MSRPEAPGPDGFVAQVHALVRTVPPGRVITYGLVAEVLADRARAAGGTPRGGARQVGRAMATGGDDVPWWRVVTAGGEPPRQHLTRALAHLRDEGTPLTADGLRVRVREAVWFPDR